MHKAVAEEVMNYLHTYFPDASIGISGSVANNTYTKGSDIDLLFLRKDYKESHSVSFTYKGIQIGIFIYARKMFLSNYLDLIYTHHNLRMTYIDITQPVYDPHGLIDDLKETVEEVMIRRKVLQDILIADLKNDIKQEFGRYQEDIYEKKESLYVILEKIAAIVFIRHYSTKLLSKKEAQNIYPLIEKADAYLYEGLKKAYPVHSDTHQIVRDLFDNYIINY